MSVQEWEARDLSTASCLTLCFASRMSNHRSQPRSRKTETLTGHSSRADCKRAQSIDVSRCDAKEGFGRIQSKVELRCGVPDLPENPEPRKTK
jgi:hypothetical protein